MTSRQEDPVLVKFREQCMKRGAASIKGIARLWAEMDDDRSRSITKEEFQRGILNHNIQVSSEDIDKLFQLFDDDGSGNLSYEEFLIDLRVSRVPCYSYFMSCKLNC